MNSTTSHLGKPLNKIIGLAVVLSLGFLLVILACLYGNWSPLVIALVFAAAHIPLVFANAFSSSSSDVDLTFDPLGPSTASALQEASSFLSGLLLFLGVSIPIMLRHLHILASGAANLSIVGGLMIYGTIHAFSLFFNDPMSDMVDIFGSDVI